MEQPSSASERQILVVDDDEAARESLKLLLGLDGHAVTEARDAAEALAKYEHGRFDLVITDYLMPNMLGDELAYTIRARAPSQPIIMVTAYVEKLKDRPGVVDAVLTKPFGVRELRLAISEPLQRVLSKPSSAALSRQSLNERASMTTRILRDILHQRTNPRKPIKPPN